MNSKKKGFAVRPETTLFALISVDGKISTGDNDGLDFDRDIPKIRGAREGLSQYNDLEKQTDFVSLNTGRVFQKVGINRPAKHIAKLPVSFVVIDSKPHLTKIGVQNLLAKSKKLYIVTTNRRHPAFRVMSESLEIIRFEGIIDFKRLFVILRKEIGITRMTIQSGGTLNALLLRNDLIDHLSVVVAPLLIGGQDTTSLIGGASLRFQKDLESVKVLRLKKATVLKHSYLHLDYDILKR